MVGIYGIRFASRGGNNAALIKTDLFPVRER